MRNKVSEIIGKYISSAKKGFISLGNKIIKKPKKKSSGIGIDSLGIELRDNIRDDSKTFSLVKKLRLRSQKHVDKDYTISVSDTKSKESKDIRLGKSFTTLGSNFGESPDVNKEGGGEKSTNKYAVSGSSGYTFKSEHITDVSSSTFVNTNLTVKDVKIIDMGVATKKDVKPIEEKKETKQDTKVAKEEKETKQDTKVAKEEKDVSKEEKVPKVLKDFDATPVDKSKKSKDKKVSVQDLISQAVANVDQEDMEKFVDKFEEYLEHSKLSPQKIYEHIESLKAVVRSIVRENPELTQAGVAFLEVHNEAYTQEAVRSERLISKLMKEFEENPERRVSSQGIPYSSLAYPGLRADHYVEAIFRLYKDEAVARGLTVAQFRRAIDDILSQAPYELYETALNSRGNLTRTRNLKPVREIVNMAVAQGLGYHDYTIREN